MVQGDSYTLSITIKMSTTTMTSSNCDGAKIMVGGVTKPLTYNSPSQKWEFKLSQAETLQMPQQAMASVQIKIGTDIYTSKPMPYPVNFGIIKEEWT